MRRTYVIANWKSHKTLPEAMQWIDSVGPQITTANHSLILCPPFPFLYPLDQYIQERKYAIRMGVQDISPFPAGAYTGAVSTQNITEFGIEFAIVGHSERRRYFHESNQEIANKVAMVIDASMTPILCVDRDNIWAQASALETGLSSQCIVAFEPIENIGTDDVDNIEDVLHVASEIRKAFGTDVPVLYGGSVDERTAQQFLQHEQLAGVLVGGASLRSESMITMLK